MHKHSRPTYIRQPKSGIKEHLWSLPRFGFCFAMSTAFSLFNHSHPATCPSFGLSNDSPAKTSVFLTWRVPISASPISQPQDLSNVPNTSSSALVTYCTTRNVNLNCSLYFFSLSIHVQHTYT